MLPQAGKKTEYHPFRTLRYKKMMSIERLAEISNVSAVTIVRVEAGRRPPVLSTRRKLLEALGVPLDQHLDIFGPMPDFRIKD